MRFVLLSVALLLGGCQSGPTFLNIESIKVTRVGSDGLHGVELGSSDTRKAIDCLYATREVGESDSANEILPPDVYLVEVKDSAGIRSFEVYTSRHMKGNKGKYYRNDCIYGLIHRG